MTIYNKWLNLLLLLFLAFSCSPTEDDVNEQQLLIGSNWILESYQIGNADTTPIPQDELYTIIFKEDQTIEGKADCNHCPGGYELGPENSISISAWCTEMACGSFSFGTALIEAFGYDLQNRYLQIYFNDPSGSIGKLYFHSE